mmetsp:Transcript_3345/g.8942  ORF Transcript_3345/g.8942 Transcript_3345/m.8942 type:complete len:351 (+) Transcript_3345:18-1070(+)
MPSRRAGGWRDARRASKAPAGGRGPRPSPQGVVDARLVGHVEPLGAVGEGRVAAERVVGEEVAASAGVQGEGPEKQLHVVIVGQICGRRRRHAWVGGARALQWLRQGLEGDEGGLEEEGRARQGGHHVVLKVQEALRLKSAHHGEECPLERFKSGWRILPQRYEEEEVLSEGGLHRGPVRVHLIDRVVLVQGDLFSGEGAEVRPPHRRQQRNVEGQDVDAELNDHARIQSCEWAKILLGDGVACPLEWHAGVLVVDRAACGCYAEVAEGDQPVVLPVAKEVLVVAPVGARGKERRQGPAEGVSDHGHLAALVLAVHPLHGLLKSSLPRERLHLVDCAPMHVETAEALRVQ